jgi:short subunit dehydrogenase-like uncharacterized protein
MKKDRIEYRTIATADQDTLRPQRAISRTVWHGSVYYLTGVFVAEAAMTILNDHTMAKELGGGILTPATLGQPFIDRLYTAGYRIETTMIDD